MSDGQKARALLYLVFTVEMADNVLYHACIFVSAILVVGIDLNVVTDCGQILFYKISFSAQYFDCSPVKAR